MLPLALGITAVSLNPLPLRKRLSEKAGKNERQKERKTEWRRERESKAQTALSLTAILHSFHIISSLITHRLFSSEKHTHTTAESAVWATVHHPRWSCSQQGGQCELDSTTTSLFHILLPSQGQQGPVFPLSAVEYQDRRRFSQEFQRRACPNGQRSWARSEWLDSYWTPSPWAQKQQKAFANRTLRSSLPLLSKSRNTSHLSLPFSCPLFKSLSHFSPLLLKFPLWNDVWLDFCLCLFLFQTWRQSRTGIRVIHKHYKNQVVRSFTKYGGIYGVRQVLSHKQIKNYNS